MVEIEKIKITDLIPAEYNPRKISDEEAEKLKNSLSTFGLVDPIVVNLKNNKIIGGHQRFHVLYNQYSEDNSLFNELNLIRLGDIGWVFIDTDLTVESEDHEKALNLALNKISGEWDNDKLTDIFEDLALNGFDTELTGFDDIELNSILEFFDDNFEDIITETEDITQKVKKKETTMRLVPGDVIKFNNHEFKVGELQDMDLLKIRLDTNYLYLIFESPPGKDNYQKFIKDNRFIQDRITSNI